MGQCSVPLGARGGLGNYRSRTPGAYPRRSRSRPRVGTPPAPPPVLPSPLAHENHEPSFMIVPYWPAPGR
jgi:hypothetical protein